MMLMSLCVVTVSCVRDPDASHHSVPEILSTTMSVEESEVRLKCKVSRSDNIKDCGFYFGLSEDEMTRYVSDLPVDDEFTFSIRGLTYGVRYYFRSFISGGDDVRMSGIQTKEIDQQLPLPVIRSIKVQGGTSVVCDYSVEDHFSGEMIICGLCWNETGVPSIQSVGKTLDGPGYGDHTTEVDGFEVGKPYYFRIYAVNGKGTAYSDEVRLLVPVPFEDEMLSEYMVSTWDEDSDGGISLEEAAKVTKIDIRSDGVSSLKGVEYLTALDTLVCRGLSYGAEGGSGGLSEVGLKANVNLTCVDLSNNRIESLDLSSLERLTSLSVGGNVNMRPEVLDPGQPFIQELVSLDISGCRNLGADLSIFTSLEELHYDARSGVNDCASMFRQMRGIRRLYAGDASGYDEWLYLLQELELLDCAGSPVRTLNLRYNYELASLRLDGCDLIGNLDLNTNPKLTDLRCMGKGLTRLELLEGHEIDGVNVNLGWHRYIPESVEIVYTPRIDDPVFKRFLLDNYDFDNDQFVSRTEASEAVSMIISPEEYSGIASLHGVEMFSALKNLNVSGQSQLTALDISGNVSLTVLACDNTSLKTLDPGCCPALVSLYAQNTSLESLDLSHNPALKEAYLSSSPIKTLYLTAAQKETLNLICDPDTEIIVVE